jgi:group I intron endonuclease
MIISEGVAARGGVYIIRHVATNRVYVGSSREIERRWRVHQSYLARAKHDNGHLRNAWKKYGSDAFSFEVIEELDEDDPRSLIEVEQYWIDSIPSEQLFNIAKKAGRPPGRSGPWPDEMREQIRRALIGHPTSDETRAKIGAKSRGRKTPPWTPERREKHAQIMRECAQRNPSKNTGKRLSDEQKEKIRQAAKARIVPEETRERLRRVNIGRKQSPDAIEKTRRANTGKRHSEERRAKARDARWTPEQRAAAQKRNIERGVRPPSGLGRTYSAEWKERNRALRRKEWLKPSRRPPPNPLRDEALRAIAAGEPPKDVAKRLGVLWATVRTWQSKDRRQKEHDEAEP